jgi:hypothetical protein
MRFFICFSPTDNKQMGGAGLGSVEIEDSDSQSGIGWSAKADESDTLLIDASNLHISYF